MTLAQQYVLADEIAVRHGCEIQTAANRKQCTVVTGRFQRGFPLDGNRIEECRAELIAAGITRAMHWLS